MIVREELEFPKRQITGERFSHPSTYLRPDTYELVTMSNFPRCFERYPYYHLVLSRNRAWKDEICVFCGISTFWIDLQTSDEMEKMI